MSMAMERRPMTLATEQRTRTELVRRHLPLVHRLARSYHQRTGVDLDDLVQVGSIGLLRAIRRFDPSVNRVFEAYAATIIGGEILHYLRDCVPLVRPPRELVELRSKVKSATSKLKQSVQREPSCEEIAREAGLCPLKVAEVVSMEHYAKPVSLDAEFELDDDNSPLKLQLTDNKYGLSQLAIEDRIMLMQALVRLKPVSLEVINLAFFQDLPQQAIASLLGISQTQVSRRLRSALRELWALLGKRYD